MAANNLRMTRQRKLVLEVLRSMHTHPSADEIFMKVRRILPRISLGTVYRNLEVLCKLGEIQKLEISGRLKRFDGTPENHYHIRCMHCDRLDDAPLALRSDLEQEIKEETGYQLMGHRLEFIGLCAACQKALPPHDGKKTLLI